MRLRTESRLASRPAASPDQAGGGTTVSLRELIGIFAPLRRYFATALAFSLAINLLYLAAPLYMMQVYDRVLSSNSEITLAMLTLIVLIAFSTLAVLDCLRARILARSATRLDKLAAGQAFASIMIPAPLNPLNPAPGCQSITDLATLRSFIAGNGMHAIFDFPWTPIYVLIIYRLHPVLGTFALLSAIALVFMALVNEMWVREMSQRAHVLGTRAQQMSEQSLRNIEVVHAMGMLADLTRRWSLERLGVVNLQQKASERAAIVSSIIRFLRLAMQSVILGLGAWLVIERATSAGAIFAASILLGRALQPVEQAAGAWKSMVGARDALVRLIPVLGGQRRDAQVTHLARPEGRIVVKKLTYHPPHGAAPTLSNVSFVIEAGEIVGVIGASGAGKSTLARLLVGAARPSAGTVSVGGYELETRQGDALRRHFGYLPQDIELFADSIAANVARFTNPEPANITEACVSAGIHDMIMRLPQGYQTNIGAGGIQLSGGWQQRVALARAIYGHPSLIVLDEPNSNLDSEGEASLAACLRRLKAKGTTVVIISHRPATLRVVDKVLILNEGRMDWYGLRDEMLRRFAGQAKHSDGALHAGS